MQKIETDILILGAGWSGLLAADLLYNKYNNKKIVILEKEQELGGLARTLNFRSFKFDIGGHGLFFKKEENANYLRKMVNYNDLLTLKRKIKVLYKNKYIDYPPNLYSVLRIEKKYVLNIFLDMFRLNKSQRQDNFEEWVKSNYGECLYKIYFRDYTEKVWGKSCNQLSASWADKRIGNNSLYKFFKSSFMRNGYGKENNPFFYYPKEGIGLLPKILERDVVNKGCQIYKGIELKQVLINKGTLKSLSYIFDKCEYEIHFKHIISSIPVTELIKIFLNATPVIKSTLQGIKYRNLILVNFIFDRRLITNWHWCYFPSSEVLFSRIHEPKLWSKDMAPEDKTLLCIEIFCDYDDFYWNMKEGDLINQVQDTLRNIGLVNGKDFFGARINKIKYAYPLHYCGFEKPLNDANSFFATFKNLHLIGRSGTHSYFDMEQCLENVRKKVEFLYRN